MTDLQDFFSQPENMDLALTEQTAYTEEQKDRVKSFFRTSPGFNDLVLETLDQSFQSDCFSGLGVDESAALVGSVAD